jgi:hypothetical protein
MACEALAAARVAVRFNRNVGSRGQVATKPPLARRNRPEGDERVGAHVDATAMVTDGHEEATSEASHTGARRVFQSSRIGLDAQDARNTGRISPR